MRIDAIDVFHVALPLRQPQSTALGQVDALRTVLVRLTSGEAAGWGEAAPGHAPLAGAEWTAGAFDCIKSFLAPAIAGRSIDTGAALGEALAMVRGNQFAKSALDTAWWDLKARIEGKPLHELLGAKREAIELGTSFDRMEAIEPFLEAIGAAFEAGFARVELKLRPGWDVNMLNVVRHEFPTQSIHVDVEGALRLDHMEMLCRMDDFFLAMVEQPLPADDLVGHAMIQETIRTPVCLDEAITTVEQAEMALELKSGQFVNLKPGRVGGLTPAVAIHDACHRGCTPCFVGAVPQSAVGTRIGLALAAKENCDYPADWFDADKILEQNLAELPPPVKDDADGRLRVKLWTEPGIGLEPDMDAIERLALRTAKLEGTNP
jgi:O-succinylbenzoate synthase